MVDNRVVEIMWLKNKFRKTSHDWATKLVATGAGSEDLNIGSKMHRVRLLQILANEEKLQQICIQILSLQF